MKVMSNTSIEGPFCILSQNLIEAFQDSRKSMLLAGPYQASSALRANHKMVPPPRPPLMFFCITLLLNPEIVVPHSRSEFF